MEFPVCLPVISSSDTQTLCFGKTMKIVMFWTGHPLVLNHVDVQAGSSITPLKGVTDVPLSCSLLLYIPEGKT